jgi:hypothetical protein
MKNSFLLMFILAIIIVFALSIFLVKNQTQFHKGKIIEHRKLTWDDFTGIPDLNSKYDATTYWYVYYVYNAPVIKNGRVEIQFKVWCEFGSNSWVKKHAKVGPEKDELLYHEQGPYYLGRIAAKRIKKALEEGQYNITNYRRLTEKIFQTELAKYLEMEKKYDFETNHMYNRAAQKNGMHYLSSTFCRTKAMSGYGDLSCRFIALIKFFQNIVIHSTKDKKVSFMSGCSMYDF